MEVQSKLMQQFCPKTSYQEAKLPDGTTHLVFKLKDQNNQPIPDNIAVAKQFYGCFNRALKPPITMLGGHLKINHELMLAIIYIEVATPPIMMKWESLTFIMN